MKIASLYSRLLFIWYVFCFLFVFVCFKLNFLPREHRARDIFVLMIVTHPSIAFLLGEVPLKQHFDGIKRNDGNIPLVEM